MHLLGANALSTLTGFQTSGSLRKQVYCLYFVEKTEAQSKECKMTRVGARPGRIQTQIPAGTPTPG